MMKTTSSISSTATVTNYNEYRYYVCNNEVIKLTVGSTGDQTHYYYGSSQTKDSTCQSLIAGAYYALGTI